VGWDVEKVGGGSLIRIPFRVGTRRWRRDSNKEESLGKGDLLYREFGDIREKGGTGEQKYNKGFR